MASESRFVWLRLYMGFGFILGLGVVEFKARMHGSVSSETGSALSWITQQPTRNNITTWNCATKQSQPRMAPVKTWRKSHAFRSHSQLASFKQSAKSTFCQSKTAQFTSTLSQTWRWLKFKPLSCVSLTPHKPYTLTHPQKMYCFGSNECVAWKATAKWSLR